MLILHQHNKSPYQYIDVESLAKNLSVPEIIDELLKVGSKVLLDVTELSARRNCGSYQYQEWTGNFEGDSCKVKENLCVPFEVEIMRDCQQYLSTLHVIDNDGKFHLSFNDTKRGCSTKRRSIVVDKGVDGEIKILFRGAPSIYKDSQDLVQSLPSRSEDYWKIYENLKRFCSKRDIDQYSDIEFALHDGINIKRSKVNNTTTILVTGFDKLKLGALQITIADVVSGQSEHQLVGVELYSKTNKPELLGSCYFKDGKSFAK